MQKTTPPSTPSQRLRVGAFVVDIAARELVSEEGSKTRVTGKAVQVLVELAKHAGEVLTRDQLMDLVWIDAFPTNDVLTQAIAVLRKALADDADAPRYIETIAKSGYRLVAVVQWIDVVPLSSVSASAPLANNAVLPDTSADIAMPPRGRARNALIVLAAALMILIGLWQFKTPQPADARTSSLQMTAPTIIVAGVGDEWSPKLSPDGAMVVYAAAPVSGQRDQLFLQATMAATSLPLTTPGYDERDILPAWSPDGREIAFKRLREYGQCSILLVAVSGGTPRRLGDCIGPTLLKFDWTPDGQALVSGGYVDAERNSASLWRMTLTEGQWQPLFPARATHDVDLEPHYSPDGRWLAFLRGLSASDLWRIPTDGGEPEQLTRIAADVRGFDWTPDGKYLVFNAYRDGKLALWSVDLATRIVAPLGIENARTPDFALRSPQMVYEIPRTQSTLMRLRVNEPDTPPERILGSSANDTAAVASPDRSAIIFYSDRSGRDRVWLAPIEGEVGVPQQIDRLLPTTVHPPTWSPDSQRFLVVGVDRNSTSSLYEVTRNSLRAQRLSFDAGEPQFADYLPSGEILVGSMDGQQRRLIRCRRVANALVPVSSIDGISYALVDRPRQRIVYTHVLRPGLYSATMDGSDERQLLADYPLLTDYRRWTLLDDRFFVLARHAQLGNSVVFRGSLANPTTAVTVVGTFAAYYPFLLGPLAENQLVFSASNGNGNDIALTRYAAPAND